MGFRGITAVLLGLSYLFNIFPIIQSTSTSFNPRDYSKRTATCKAVKRDADHALVDINIGYVDINPEGERVLLLVHGWPSLWSTWSKQIQHFKDDYRLIVIDQRGFGESSHPDDVKTSGTLFDLVGDLVCVLEDAGVSQAICIGHDWGSQVCYEAGRSRPDIFSGVIGVTVPYIPASGPFVPMKHLTPFFPKLTYQLFFDTQTETAVEELDRDIRRSIRATLRSKASPPPDSYLRSSESFLAAWSHVEEIPPVPYFTEEEEDYFVEQFTLQGFKNTLHFYTNENRYAAWKFAHEQGNHTIPQPVLAIYPTHDPVADWEVAAGLLKSADFLPQLTTKMVEGSHWVHMENPVPVNEAIHEWLTDIHGAGTQRATDEL